MNQYLVAYRPFAMVVNFDDYPAVFSIGIELVVKAIMNWLNEQIVSVFVFRFRSKPKSSAINTGFSRL
ncbi:hypothetical protein SAMN04487967_2626 [Natronorubrum sediminis]|uniref:Uncharacterized protein n=1 Tax=Natronorubrum sediminis TaxID=640943 RepID=A0A1H6G1G6_9EURY|nr:hypothetical protein SAMN04487967_2626 [Natronorubrum sediminis]